MSTMMMVARSGGKGSNNEGGWVDGRVNGD